MMGRYNCLQTNPRRIIVCGARGPTYVRVVDELTSEQARGLVTAIVAALILLGGQLENGIGSSRLKLGDVGPRGHSCDNILKPVLA